MTTSSEHFDLIILGGGLAGLSAGNRALELGLTAAVVEQGDGDAYPCNSRFSGGILHVAFKNVKEDVSRLRAAVAAANHGTFDAEVTDALVNASARAADWLREQGAKFIRVGQIEWQQWVMAPPRPLTPGLDWKGRGPDVTLRTLLEKFEKRGGRMFRNCAGKALIEGDGKCAGLEVSSAAGAVLRLTGNVLIADGGFQGNTDMLGAHIAPAPDKLLQRGAGNARGMGLRMAQAMGAATSDLSTFYGHLLSRDALANPKLWPYPVLDELATAGIVVGPGGERVTDEGLGGVYIANQIARRPDPLDCYVVFDAEAWRTAGTANRIAANPNLERAGARFFKADSIEALAASMQVPSDALVRTVNAFNDAAARDALASLAPPRTTGQYAAVPLRKAPFYAFPTCVGITHTTGGLLVDGHARVRRATGGVIDGLYAAGAALGGVEGGPKAGYIGGLMKALVFGMLAAEDVAARRAA